MASSSNFFLKFSIGGVDGLVVMVKSSSIWLQPQSPSYELVGIDSSAAGKPHVP